MGDIKIEGLDKLQKALKDNITMNHVKEIVQGHGIQLENKMKNKAIFTKGYSLGTTNKSIRLEMQDGGFTAVVGAETEYSPYLEYGTRFMDAQPFVKPAYNEQVALFKADMQKLVK